LRAKRRNPFMTDLWKFYFQKTSISFPVFYPTAHDRFLCIDDTVYHIGASLKDLGKKWFAFSRMEIGTDGLIGKM
jgi:hypothetical protein